MNYLVQAAPPEHYAWLSERLNMSLRSDFRAIEALDSKDLVRGFVGFENWTPNSVQVCMAADTPIVARRLMGPAFEYAFIQTGRGLMLGTIRASNARSLALTRAFGFRETYRQRDGWAPGDDVIHFELRREDCRWLQQPARRAA